MERKPYAGDAAGTAVLVAGRVASFLLQAFLLLNAAHNARVVLSLLNLLPPSSSLALVLFRHANISFARRFRFRAFDRC